MEKTEGVDEAVLDVIVKTFALFGCVAGVALVVFGAGEIDGLVGDVEIATDDDGFGFF